jgi:release factor glutamine methyltransferase
MNLRSKRIFFKNCVFNVLESVYEPAEDSFLLADNLTIEKDDLVLDLGTGCGLLAILAAKKSEKVVAIDVSPVAVQCSLQNAVLNNVANRIEVRQGDLFEPVKKGERFDVILFNAPYLPSEEWEEQELVSQAWAGGKTGRKVIDRFIREVSVYLSENGRILLVQSTLSNVNQSLRMLVEHGLEAKVIAEKKADFETIVIIEAKRFSNE